MSQLHLPSASRPQVLIPIIFALALLLSLFSTQAMKPFDASDKNDFDVVVYGGTPAGIMSAVAASRAGETVCLLEASYLIGGMMAGGLTKTDLGKADTVGGLSREFFNRVLAYYTKEFGPDSQQVKESTNGYFFEPKVADKIFREMLDEADVVVGTHERLVDATVEKNRIQSINVKNYQTQKTATVTGKYFIDATYEGDLLAAANVPYRVGREAAAEYNEPLAGANSGPEMYLGKGDHRVQAYNMRSTVSNRADNLIPFPKPENYDPTPFEGFIKTVEKHNVKTIEELLSTMPKWGWVNGKSDPNVADYVGANYAYVEGDYEQRERIVRKVQDYWLSMWYMLQNDPRLPEEFRQSAMSIGLPKDEYLESGHVSPQVYVRVGRRMLGRYMLSQNDAEHDRWKEDGICLGSYNFDSHVVQDIRTENGLEQEGYFIQLTDPYEIPYRSITPFSPDNLLVVCAVSATHVAFSTLRMEPVFMMIGQAGGTAAHLAHRDSKAVQDISVPELREKLTEAGIPFAAPFRPVVEIALKTEGAIKAGQPVEFEIVEKNVRAPIEKIYWNFDGSGSLDSDSAKASYTFPAGAEYPVSLIVTDADGNISVLNTLTVKVEEDGVDSAPVATAKPKLEGRWDRTRGSEPEYRQRVALMDGNEGKGNKKATFSTKIPRTGKYKVALAYSFGPNRADAVPVTVEHSKGTEEITFSQKRKKETPFIFAPLGEFEFEEGQPATITVSNKDTEGFVVVDEARWIYLGE